MSGTRFKLYPQPGFLGDFAVPETIYISAPAGTIGPGPSDQRIYTVYPIGKPAPYGFFLRRRDRQISCYRPGGEKSWPRLRRMRRDILITSHMERRNSRQHTCSEPYVSSLTSGNDISVAK